MSWNEKFFGGFFYGVILFPFVFMIPHIILNAIFNGKFLPFTIVIRIIFSIGVGYYETKDKKDTSLIAQKNKRP